MIDFLKEFWVWILLPFVLVLGGLLVLIFLSDGDGFSDFTYPVF